jgi:hypothetical protein
MSIYVEISFRVNEGRLALLDPAMPGTLRKRKMYVSPELETLLGGPWQDTAWEERCGYLRADLDRFIEGKILAVAQKPYGSKTSYLKRLEPPRDEVWEIRSRDPNPSLRIFGRFAEKDLFIALTWAKRIDLGGPAEREWRVAKEACNAEWRKLFPTYPPKTGVTFHDYLSNIILV